MSGLTINVFLGPSGSGKTAAVLERFRAARDQAVLLVPSSEVAARMRRRLAELDPDVNPEGILSFTEAIRDIARTVGIPEPIRRARQGLILSDICETEQFGSGYFHRMQDAPRFVPALANSIRDLKLSGVSPNDLSSASEALAEIRSATTLDASDTSDASDAWVLEDGSMASKVKEISRIFSAYQEVLSHHRLVDDEDLCRLAIDAMPEIKTGRWAARLVLVDGFYRFSKLWRDLLAAMACRGSEVIFTLPADQKRPLLFSTPLRTLGALRQEFETQERWFEPPSPDGTDNPLRLLSAALFAPRRIEQGVRDTLEEEPSEPLPAASGTIEADDQANGSYAEPPPILLVDAPSRYVEVEIAARAILRERNQTSLPWSAFAIIVRSAGDYVPLVDGIMERYGIPCKLGRGRPLMENGAVRTLSRFLQISHNGWQREDVIEFLRSDRLEVGTIGADFARVLARKLGVRESRSGWERLAVELERSNECAAETLRGMLEIDSAIEHGTARAQVHADSVRLAVSHFRLAEPMQGRWGREDDAAIRLAMQAADELAAQAASSDADDISLASFCRRLQVLWRAQTVAMPEAEEAVSVLEPYDVQQLNPEVVFVLGLTERVFPRRVMDDPFFRDDEREALRRRTGVRLEPQKDRADEERLLFYLTVSTPRRRLALSFPRSTEESDTLPSFFIDEVRDALESSQRRLPAVVRTLADVAPTWAECVNDRDRLLSACSEVEERLETRIAGTALPLLDEVLQSRTLPPSPTLSALSAARFGSARRYSVSEIETHRRCPFQHFARYGLRLTTEEQGGGPLDRGALLHDTMRRGLRWAIGEDALPKSAALREALLREMADCLSERTIDARPHRQALMERAVRAALETFSRREELYRDLFGMAPAHLEIAFGMEEANDDMVRTRDYDPASTPQPLQISDGEGGVIQICGAIDRLDLGTDGRTALVLDYKMGATQQWAHIKEGRSIQIPIYLMAVEQLWGFNGAVGCYDSPRDKGRRRFFRRELVNVRLFQPVPGSEDGTLAKPVSPDEFQEAVTAAQVTVRSAIASMRAGGILPTPGDNCRSCDYSDLCRTAPNGTHDGELLQ